MKWVREIKERAAVRRAVGVECQAVAEEGFRLVGTRVLDASESGVLVLSDEAVRLGEPVILSMRVPRGRSWIDAECSVARIVRGYRRTDPLRAVGLRFEAIDPVDRAILLGSLAPLPPPVPARHLRLDYAATVHDIASLPAMDYAAAVRAIAEAWLGAAGSDGPALRAVA